MKINILCIGDIVGRPGRRALAEKLADLVEKHAIDCVIANAENAAGGSGMTSQIYNKLIRYGVNIITLGDHAFRKRDIIATLDKENNIARPANISENCAGKGVAFYQTNKGPTVAVINLIGRIFMKPADCPYSSVDKLLSKIKQQADVVVVDMHAEATSDKVAMGYYLDGKVGCLFGTHTHVVTADEKILPKGTGYITDIGMTGAHDSVIGRNKDSVIKSFRTQMPFAFELATKDVRINGIVATIDANNKKCERIQRVCICTDQEESTLYDSDDGKPEYLNNGNF